VVIISVDGLRPDALEQADTPVLDTLKSSGAYTTAHAVVPSVTLVNHASMLGGMTPDKHGIFWNSDDTGLGKITGPTLFSLAHEAGYTTAMVVGKPKLEDLVLPNSVDNYIYAGFTDAQVTGQILTLLQTGLPHVLFIHLPDVDSAGHSAGWMSTIQLWTLSWTDSSIGEIVAALQAGGYLNQTLLIITADHGGSGKDHGSTSPEDTLIPWLAVGPGIPAGRLLQQDVVIYDTAATALYALNIPIPAVWDGQPILEIFDKAAKT
jgi:predicted AlkP superfamily pyrophosphatase or phosphodiesterase